jgi:hypothetical protein
MINCLLPYRTDKQLLHSAQGRPSEFPAKLASLQKDFPITAERAALFPASSANDRSVPKPRCLGWHQAGPRHMGKR